ncbi:hypothetical protein NYG95_07630 [Campylobacter felis]|uniref:Uncharacterized protein n=1 Tax=Campylobacter felis TaxID=2974565 RepID=A0ABT7I5G5_9BACT|nr:hypothetical protein [Campylobacter upsaliensis]MDL0101288.1 hypothetical protein [Campylobacter felis]MDL0104133.1 hypothetical protein [Campylobacter felis]MDL0107477.1 hypothetical protein [Campylobacter felis]MDL0147474.1 hypothetical protein [Campylobacter felis]
MKIVELMERLRRRLKDEGVYLKFSDEELLASINQEQNMLISDLEMNVCKFEKKLNENDNVLHLPKLMLKVVVAKLNGVNLPFLNYKAHLKDNNVPTHLMGFSNMQSVAVEPKNKALGRLEVWVNLCVFHRDKEEELFLNDLFVNALLYSLVRNILQAENSELSMQKIAFFDNLLKNELSRIKDIVSNTREEQVLFSKVNEV